MGDEHRPGVWPTRTAVITLYTAPPADATVICVDELGPVVPRTVAPAPGWACDGQRIKTPLEYSRGQEKVWVYGALRVRDGQALTLTACSRNTVGYLRLLATVERAHPLGTLYLITDNLTSHTSWPVQQWLATHPRIQQVFIPKGACWLNLVEGWWRLFRREALAGQTFANGAEIELATRVATDQLNRRANPWIWARPVRPKRQLRRCFVYRL